MFIEIRNRLGDVLTDCDLPQAPAVGEKVRVQGVLYTVKEVIWDTRAQTADLTVWED